MGEDGTHAMRGKKRNSEEVKGKKKGLG